jgi:hypothetical protein
LDRRLGGSQSLSGRGGEEKNSQPLSGLEPPIIQPIKVKKVKVKFSLCLTKQHAIKAYWGVDV